MSLTRKIMAELARRQLTMTILNARQEDPDKINTVTMGRAGTRLRRMFAQQNHESNEALQAFWRRQIEKYT